MAQLNDLLVLGKSSLLGELKVNSNITAPQLILEPSSGEGGQIQLKTALNDLTNSGIVIDTANGAFRIFGLPSRNGSTRTGNGTVLTIDPYAKTISGGYSFDGVSARTQKIETWQNDKSKTYGASYPLYAWWETNSECRLTVDNYTVKVNYADTSGLANSVAWGNVTGKPSSYPPSSHTHDFITYKDTRNNNQTPDDLQAGVTIHLKANGTDGLNDGGSYHPILAFKDWGDYSGGPYGQITTTANQNLYFRSSTSGTAWGSWYKVAIQNKDNTFSGYNTFSNRITQGSPSSDTTIANMNRFQSDLFVQGNGSAPNGPKVAGFYLGKSTSDENRHMDIVSGGDYSYIDFNKASVVEDYKARILVNVSSGYTEFNWGSRATNKKFQINGALGATSFTGNGAGLTSLNASNISSGTLAAARLPNHASTATTYGVGDATHYGHVILYPAASCTSYTSDSGGACTPAAVKKAVELFGGGGAIIYKVTG